MIQVDATAPTWAQRLAKDTQTEIDNSIGIFVSRVPYAVASLPLASKYLNKIALLSDGTFWLAKSNGVNWLYPDNSVV
jgi:hypothetical protein